MSTCPKHVSKTPGALCECVREFEPAKTREQKRNGRAAGHTARQQMEAWRAVALQGADGAMVQIIEARYAARLGEVTT